MTPEVETDTITGEERDALSGGLRQRHGYRRRGRGRADKRRRKHRLEAAHDLADEIADAAGSTATGSRSRDPSWPAWVRARNRVARSGEDEVVRNREASRPVPRLA